MHSILLIKSKHYTENVFSKTSQLPIISDHIAKTENNIEKLGMLVTKEVYKHIIKEVL